MGERTRHGRIQLARPGINARTGAAPATVDYWYLHRAHIGFPEKAATDGDGRDWWWLTDIDAFRARQLATRAARFTHVNRQGDPQDLLTAPQAAKVLGYKDHRSLPPALRDNPDRADELPSGRLRRYWYRRTVWAFADGRPLRHSTGRPAGTGTGRRQPHPYADDPRLPAALQLVADTQATGRATTGLGRSWPGAWASANAPGNASSTRPSVRCRQAHRRPTPRRDDAHALLPRLLVMLGEILRAGRDRRYRRRVAWRSR